jgi:uncharacterized protein (TIGR02646 family)
MRKVDRTAAAAPPSLTGANRAGPNELKRARAHFNKPPPRDSFPFTAYKGDDVRHTLHALFHGKCAYCEARYDVVGPVDIEHFRPKNADPNGTHQGYWWLAAVWTNLLPSCIDCNRKRGHWTPTELASLTELLKEQKQRPASYIQTGKESCFPVAGPRLGAEPLTAQAEALLNAEQALLLDPCRDTPTEHIVFHIDRTDPLGMVYPLGQVGAPPHIPPSTDQLSVVETAARAANVSPRGAVSIQTYGLNRLGLVQERTRVLRQLEFLGGTIEELSLTADHLSGLTVNAPDAAVRDHAVQRLRAIVQRMLAHIKAMSEPQAAFSTMVAAWIEAFISTGGEQPGPSGL